jgi:AbrB family looped-hinge helix DNA binding protein
MGRGQPLIGVVAAIILLSSYFLETTMGLPRNSLTILSTKGQVILPKAVRDQLNWAPGTRLTVEQTEDGVLLKAGPVFPRTSIDAVFASMPADGRVLSIEDMDAVIAGEAQRRARD